MKKKIVLLLSAVLLLTGLGACEKKSGEAVVIGKDYVAAVKEGEELKDERATSREQWIVKARMVDNGRTIEVHVDRGQWEKLRKEFGSKSRIAWPNIPEPFGTPRLSDSGAGLRLQILIPWPTARDS